MSHAILYAKWAAYTTGTLTAWWLLSKLAAVLVYIRRMPPPPRHLAVPHRITHEMESEKEKVS